MHNWLKISVLFFLQAFISYITYGQKTSNKQCAVAFYNVENLFDTIDEPNKEDDEFTPGGAYHYTSDIYQKKLHNIANVLQGLARSINGPALIGIAEVENGNVLKDLCAEPALIKKNYQYIWYDGPDIRGIDVALLYDPKQFALKKSVAIPVYITANGYTEHSRDILLVQGTLAGEEVYILVNHWPSRRDGKDISSNKRLAVAKQNKNIVDSLLKIDATAKVIVMGDMNDNPTDQSIRNGLQAIGDKHGRLYNPWIDVFNSGKGTCRYKQTWQLFDQIIISGSFNSNKGWIYDRVEIYNPIPLRDKYTKGRGFPYRSFKGTYWVNGYSDHFPVVLYLKK